MGARNRETIVRNFVERYGIERLRRLVDLLAESASGQDIATEFAVSRERVRQWKNAFGEVVTIYQVHAEVRAALLK